MCHAHHLLVKRAGMLLQLYMGHNKDCRIFFIPILR